MLGKDEKLRLASILDVITNDTAEGIMYLCNEQTVKWLAQKCKELNDNINEIDKMLATALQVLGNAGILEEYLKFRNQ